MFLFSVLIIAWFQINHQKLLGEINFFPLNRLIAKPRREVNDPVRNVESRKWNENYMQIMIFIVYCVLVSSR